MLCVAVMLSVMVLGAGAAFSDQDQIENTEAVNMCSALNIIGGYEDGTFHPERNIKRSEVTKMICVALNGGQEPNVGTSSCLYGHSSYELSPRDCRRTQDAEGPLSHPVVGTE